MPEFKLQRFRGGWAFCEYRDGQRVSRRKLDAGDARSAQEELDQIVAGQTKGPVETVAKIWAAYREDRIARTISANMEWSGRAILPFFGSLVPTGIKTATCRKYVSMRREAGRQNGTIITELGHLRAALGWAEKNGLIEKAPYIERPSQPAPRERYLTRDEADRLIAAATTPHVRLFILLAIGTAGRKAALLGLRWDKVDFERGLVNLRQHDIGPAKGRSIVPMNAGLRVALLEAREGAATDYVIEWARQRVTTIRRGLTATAARAGVPDVTPHVFRHTAAVWMAEDGQPMTKIAAFLGHSDSRITERVYARFNPDHLQEAASSLDLGGPRRVR